jgi:hypothetical protein
MLAPSSPLQMNDLSSTSAYLRRKKKFAEILALPAAKARSGKSAIDVVCRQIVWGMLLDLYQVSIVFFCLESFL